MKPKSLYQVSTNSRKSVNRVLADVRGKKATQVVVWYAVAGKETGVVISEGTDRVKAIGGLTAAAMDVWSEE